MFKSRCMFAALVAVLGLGAGQWARADLSGFVGIVGFDKDANLSGSPGVGLRWGKSSRILGGETSLMVAFPERKLSVKDLNLGDVSTAGVPTSKGTATSIFYEGRFLVNIPLGVVTPFADLGWGAILTTSTDPPKQLPLVPTEIGGVPLTGEQLQKAEDANRKIQATNQALKVASKLQHNTAFSYGVGARKSLNARMALRVDLRQYAVLSVKGFVADQAQKKLQEQVGQNLPVPDLAEKNTTFYKELSLGVNFRF